MVRVKAKKKKTQVTVKKKKATRNIQDWCFYKMHTQSGRLAAMSTSSRTYTTAHPRVLPEVVMVMHEHCDREYKEGIPLWSEHTLETLQLLHPDEDVGWVLTAPTSCLVLAAAVTLKCKWVLLPVPE